ncbi:MAG: class III poly(R)-hydroxyalkanoic acid synthase subunit PhaC [Desulforhopalus sp.]|jgi:polyhydroxyalkanoate synthase|nr:class III poly(R)-hydroxyalkanoic acid synthase subunit PhaC [Desulforhopalus sp.]
MTQPKIPVDLILKSLAEEAESAQKRMGKAADVLLGDLETDIATTPYEVVYQQDRVKLKHYKPIKKKKVQTPLLLIYALINRETMLDLSPGRSVVENFLQQGVDLYMIDWGYPTRKDRFLGIDDHVNIYINDIVDFIREREKVPKINLMGICMGGTFSVIFSALQPEKIQNLITTVTPTSFDIDTGLLNIWMRKVPVDQITDTFGNIPGDMLNFGFLLLNPARLMIDKYVGFYELLDDKQFVENFIRMEKWIFDSPDIPGETFREFIKDCFQENLLIQNKMVVGGKRVDLKKLTMPLLNIYGKFDHLVPPEACEQLTGKVGSKDTEDICLKTGHIGIYVSSKYQREFVPKIAQWLMERDKQPVKKPRPGVSTAELKTAKQRITAKITTDRPR